MKRHDKKHTSASTVRIAKDRKLDYFQNLGMTNEQRKAWDRKPYGLGDKDGHKKDP